MARITINHKMLLIPIIMTLLFAGCGGQSQVQVGYQPPFVPIKVSINQRGEISLSSSYSLSTPIGTFDIGAGYSIAAIRQSIDVPVLIIRVDDVVTVYELSPGNTFNVEFVGNDQYYRKVALQRHQNNDIVLELESISSIVFVAPNVAPVSTTTTSEGSGSGSSISCPGAFPTRLSIGARAKVVATPRLVVREAPGTGSDPVYGHSLSPGRTITILDGPVCNGGMLWWKGESGVITLTNGKQHNVVGWMAEESGDQWMLEPIR